MQAKCCPINFLDKVAQEGLGGSPAAGRQRRGESPQVTQGANQLGTEMSPCADGLPEGEIWYMMYCVSQQPCRLSSGGFTYWGAAAHVGGNSSLGRAQERPEDLGVPPRPYSGTEQLCLC